MGDKEQGLVKRFCDLCLLSVGLISLIAATTAAAAPRRRAPSTSKACKAGTIVTQVTKGAGINGCNENGTIEVTSQKLQRGVPAPLRTCHGCLLSSRKQGSNLLYAHGTETRVVRGR
jgi:hypothetical protein